MSLKFYIPVALLKLAETYGESDTHLLLGYLLALNEVHQISVFISAACVTRTIHVQSLEYSVVCRTQTVPSLPHHNNALMQAEDSTHFFSKLVPSKFSLELAIFYTCLQLYATTASLDQPLTTPHPYLHPPTQLVDHVMHHVTSVDQSDGSQSYPLVSQLKKFQELLNDYIQGEVLLGLGLGN